MHAVVHKPIELAKAQQRMDKLTDHLVRVIPVRGRDTGVVEEIAEKVVSLADSVLPALDPANFYTDDGVMHLALSGLRDAAQEFCRQIKEAGESKTKAPYLHFPLPTEDTGTTSEEYSLWEALKTYRLRVAMPCNYPKESKNNGLQILQQKQKVAFALSEAKRKAALASVS